MFSHVDVEEDDLREQVVKYDHQDGLDALLRSLETHGKPDTDRLPEWDEFQDPAADYDVGLLVRPNVAS